MDQPDLPELGEYLWHEYVDITNGCEKVGYLEIDAYQRVTGSKLTPWEISLMIKLDSIRRRNG